MDQSIKTCSTCKTAKPLGDFNKYAKADDGRQPRCRECQREKRVAWYEANREREIAKAQAWNTENADRVRANARKRRAKDPERFRLAARETYARHSKKYIARASARRYANHDYYLEREREWRARRSDRIAELARGYRKTNPYVKWSETAKYHRRRAAMTGGPTGKEIQAKMDYYGSRCWICGDHASSVDHVKPLSAGGLHVLANLRPACGYCNTKKHARWYGVDRIDELVDWVRDRPEVAEA